MFWPSAIRSALLLALLLATGRAAAADHEMLMLEVSCNQGPVQQSLALRDAAGEFSIEEATADGCRLNGHRPVPIVQRGIRFLPLAAFAGAETEFDPATLSLSVTIPPKYLLPQVEIVRDVQDPMADVGLGAYLDYDISYQDLDQGSSDFAAVVSPNFFSPFGVVKNTLIYRNGNFDYPDEQDDRFDDYNARIEDGWVRLQTTWQRDYPERMESYRVGDGVLPSGMLGSVARFGGVQVATDFATQPTFVTFPLPAVSGSALLRSSTDLYVNGRLADRGELDPGPFSLQQIPVTTGAGEVRLVTRDLAGREQVFTTEYYATPQVLRRDLAEYAYTVGVLRENYGIKSNDYDDVFFSGVHRVGLTDAFTVEGLTEFSHDVNRAGAGVAWLNNRIGVSSFGVSLSNSNRKGWGTEWSASHDYQTRRFRLAASLRVTTDGFRQLTSLDEEFVPKYRYSLGGGFNMERRGSLSASYIQQGYRGADDISFLSLNYSNSLGPSSFVTAYATYADAGDSDTTVGISFTRSLGRRRSASTGLSHNDQGTRATAQIRSNLPVGPGFGYDLTAGIDDNDTEWQGRVDAASRIGRYSLGADRDQEGTSWGVNASGSAAWIGGRPFLAREIRDSFAVVRVNGFENTRVYLENQEIGKTDATGRILVPGLRPFQENRVRIALQDLPLTARIEEKEIVVAPYAGAGVTVDFRVRDGNDVMLRMLIPDGSAAPQGAVVVMEGQDRRFPVGIDGAVYLQDVATGTSGVLVWQDKRCGFTIHLPEDGRPVPNLGDVMCAYTGSE